ncbi:MAG: DedA family protein [Planctomycetota bacterium]
MTDWVATISNEMGYVGIVFLMFAENVFPPIPSEVVMPAAGYSSETGRLSLIGVIVAGMIGSVLGAIPLYYLGAWAGRERVERWAGRWGDWLTVSRSEMERANRWFEDHGGKVVFLCRFVPGVRSLISIPAGVVGMPMPRFLLLTALGTGIWAAGLAWAGSKLGEEHEVVSDTIDYALYAVIGIGVVVYVTRLIAKRKERRATR